MKLGIEAARMSRALLVALTAVLILVGVVACSSEEPSAPPTDIVMPNLVGMYWMDAEPQLRELGWTGAIVKGPNVPVALEDRNRVMTQEPPAGERVTRDGAITLQFGS